MPADHLSPSDDVVVVSARRDTLRAPQLCPGCGSTDSLIAAGGEWTLNQPIAIAAAVAACAYPLLLVWGRELLLLLHQGPRPGAPATQWLVGIPVMMAVGAYYMARRTLGASYWICSRCSAEGRSLARLYGPAIVGMGLTLVAFGLVGAVAAIVAAFTEPGALPLAAGFSVGILAVSAGILWPIWRYLRWLLRSRPFYIQGDPCSAGVHARSPVFIAGLRSALTEPEVNPPAVGRRPAYSPLKTMGQLVVAVALLGVAANLADLGNTSHLISLLGAGPLDDALTARIAANDSVRRVTGLALLATTVGVFIATLFWLYRARRNLEALGVAGLESSPGRAVASFLIPLENLYRPWQVLLETWKATMGTSGDGRRAWLHARPSPLLTPWWLLTLLAGIFSSLSFSFFRDSAILGGAVREGLGYASYAGLGADLAQATAFVLLMLIVTSISRMQDERSQRTHVPRTG
jgi:hypothetical protein